MLSNIIEYVRTSLSSINAKVRMIKNIFIRTEYKIIAVFVQQIKTIFITKYDTIHSMKMPSHQQKPNKSLTLKVLWL